MNPFAASRPTQILAPITRVEAVAPRHFLMSLRAPELASQAQAGQFVHLLARDAAQFDPLLRRAFSLLAVRPAPPDLENSSLDAPGNETGDGEIDILFRVEGAVTSQLARKQKGEFIDVIGPLGQPFDLSLFHVKQANAKEQKQEQGRPILVGGGVGVPPLIFLGETLKRNGQTPLMLLGARRKEEIIGQYHFERLQIETRIATDDGSIGLRGRVTDLLETALQEMQAVVYACGPLAMLQAVAKVAESCGAPCQVSMEENMPCGIGVCNGCVVPMKARADSRLGEETRTEKTDYERYQRVCVAGPALWSHLVDWEAL